MPTPGFPEWLGPGAIVTERPSNVRYVTGLRYVVMDVELQLPNGEDTQGAHAIALAPLTEIPTVGGHVDMTRMHVVNLPAILESYDWSGEYIMPDGTLVGVGTTMPVQMAATALQPMGTIVIQGTPELDGEYVVQSVAHHTGVRMGIDIELRTRESILEPDAEAAMEELAAMGQQMFPDAYNPEEEAIPNVDDAGHPWEAVPRTEAPASPELETGMPRVDANQVWLLPAPNEGLWRTSFTQHHLQHRNPGITLTHARERDRVMRCTGTWLIEHGVRQEPPDPRANRPGQQIVVGQIWEFNPDAGTRYRRIPRWRVHAINESAGQVCLMAADGSGKRVFLPPARIVALATYAGDGIPRRTAYEHILDADDDS